MQQNLTSTELTDLIHKVFAPQADDRSLLILVDVPNDATPDNSAWQERRQIASEWRDLLRSSDLGMERVEIVYFENVGNNNADLPQTAFLCDDLGYTDHIHSLEKDSEKVDLIEWLAGADIVLAPTEFSATAPLKVLARQHNFRAATMAGFKRAMLPALGIDYDRVHEKVMQIKRRLDPAAGIEMLFEAEGQSFEFFVDLRHRTAHPSSGLLRERGSVGNLPSGETYIVPYEGELEDDSLTAGELPVQFENEVVIYQVQSNRAAEVTSAGHFSEIEKQKIQVEPAYGNIAEIGFGVLKEFGITPIDSTLLDEKLGLHIAFGRSDHFGGATSPQDFTDPKQVVHIDRIYIREVQSKVRVKSVVLVYESKKELIIENGEYVKN